ncbi:unnamed protein product [Brachionus calyciflorus]|uniref:Uncharacterized protein n=1 Tax=Brachionus calyciflorus TaxID=104777 RepID=A0A814EKJ8_9BILA|nr:unnamed protein product [Brachionus calyciflorus]
MCRKVKDVKKEEINRLFEKYEDVVNGKFDTNVHRIMNFTRLVIPTLAEQFKEQTNVRYWCMFSSCFPHQRSYKTKQNQKRERRTNKNNERDSEIICLDETFSTCSLVDISLDEKSIICLD